MSRVPKLFKNPLFILSILVWLYVLIPLVAPIAYINGASGIGKGINDFYESFCHQRVERSIFLFSKDSFAQFYSVGELKDVGYLPMSPDGRSWPEYYGHDYVGNDVVGYKVPLCIRDIALYGAYALTLLYLSLIRKKTLMKILTVKNLYTISLILALPMMIDGVVQTFIEGFEVTSVSMVYINSISKRIITGVLFGIGVALATAKLFNTSTLTKTEEKGKIEV